MQKTSSQSSIGSQGSQGKVAMSARTLEDALHSVKLNAFHMKKQLDQRQETEALRYAAQMLIELAHQPGSSSTAGVGGGGLDPKQYYELYMAIFDELRFLQMYLQDNCLLTAVPASEPVSPMERSSAVGDSEGHKENAALNIQPDDKLNTMQAHKSKLAELYELVQYNSSIIPRLYLMLTIGSVYMQQDRAPKRDLLLDLLDMCKGVQHPMRGLFVRYYLLQVVRDKLPVRDGESVPGDRQGSLQDTLFFIIQNFTEMNKLWVRLQYQGHSRDKSRREQERKELRLLVGSNIVRLSQLEQITIEIYSEQLLPKIIEQIISCKDVIAQEYLIEAILQVFQDDFHLKTLDSLLAATGRLHPDVNIKNIIITLVDRISAYAKREKEQRDSISDEPPSALEAIPLFDIFYKQISAIIESRESLILEDRLALLHSLTNFCMSCYPGTIGFYDKVLALAQKQLAASTQSELEKLAAARFVMSILQAPISTYPSIFSILKSASTADLTSATIAVLPFSLRHNIGCYYLGIILKNEIIISDADILTRLLSEWMSTLVKDQKDGSGAPDGIDVWRDEQVQVAKFVHLLRNPGADEQFLLLNAAKKLLASGGSTRYVFTIPPLVYECVKLGKMYNELRPGSGVTLESIERKKASLFKFINQIISLVLGAGHFSLALQLFLAPIEDPSVMIGHEMAAYEFVVQAFTIYEESISDSKTQISLLQQIVGSLMKVSNTGLFSVENYDTLITKCTLYSSKHLKKDDQCKAVLSCAALFWGRDLTEVDGVRISKLGSLDAGFSELAAPQEIQPPVIPELEASPWAEDVEEPTTGSPGGVDLISPGSIPNIDKWFFRDGKRVLECLQKSLKIADSCMDSVVSAQLFVEILNYYIYHFAKGNQAITLKYLNGLIDLAFSNIQALRADASISADNSVIVEESSPKAASAVRRNEKFFNSTLLHLQNLRNRSMASSDYEENKRWENITFQEILATVQEWET